MNNFLSNVLPQDSTLEVRTSRAYNIAVAASALLAALGIAFGMHAMFVLRTLLQCKSASGF